ncbi:MAG: GntR family transcriptional regulator, partial [Candidatus Ventricola sp.]
MNWSFQGDAPIYTQLVEQIKVAIATGAFPPGERLPSVRDLATEAGVNPNTMQRALAQLESEQLVYSQRTAGRFVTEDRSVIDAAKRELAQRHVERFLAAMRRLGLNREEIDDLLRQGEGKGKEADECPDM